MRTSSTRIAVERQATANRPQVQGWHAPKCFGTERNDIPEIGVLAG